MWTDFEKRNREAQQLVRMPSSPVGFSSRLMTGLWIDIEMEEKMHRRIVRCWSLLVPLRLSSLRRVVLSTTPDKSSLLLLSNATSDTISLLRICLIYLCTLRLLETRQQIIDFFLKTGQVRLECLRGLLALGRVENSLAPWVVF